MDNNNNKDFYIEKRHTYLEPIIESNLEDSKNEIIEIITNTATNQQQQTTVLDDSLT